MSRKLQFKTLEIRSFRGIKDLTLNLEDKSLVVCGPNGSGKSSITQAFEYLFTGKVSAIYGIKGLNHNKSLIHRGDKKSDLLVRAKIKKNIVARSFKNGYEINNHVLEEDFKNGSFILNRRKLLSLIDTRPKERYSQISGLISFNKYDSIDTNLKQGKNLIDKEIKQKDEDIENLKNEISSYYKCENDENYQCINRILDINGIETIDEKTDLKKFMKDNNIIDSTKIFSFDIAKTNAKYLKVLDEYEELTLTKFKSIQSLLSILTESKEIILSEKSDKCPVCQNNIESKGIIDEINPKINEMEKSLESFDAWKDEINGLIDELSEINHELKAFYSKYPQFELDYDLTNLIKSLKGLSDFDKKISEMDKEALTRLDDDIKSLKEKYDSNNEELSKTLDNLFKLIEIEELEEDKERLCGQLDIAKKTSKTFSKIREEEIKTILENIKSTTDYYYSYIHGDDEILSPDLSLSNSGGLILKMLFDGECFDPRAYASEGHIDSLGLCIFLAFVKTYNEHKFIILDDIISTVDLEHKEQIIRLLFEEFGDYTFIITTHNKLWFEQLSRLSISYNQENKFKFIEITAWDKDNGPKLSNYLTSREIIEGYVKEGNIDNAGNAIRKYLEDVLHNICETNRIELTIKSHRSVEDYLTPLNRFKKEMFDETKHNHYYNNVFKELDKVKYMGNLLSHRNEESKDLSMEDIKKYKDAVFDFEDAFKCKDHPTKYLRFNKSKKYGECTNTRCDYILFLNKKQEELSECPRNKAKRDIYQNKGLNFIKEKKYKKALQSFDKAINLDKNNKKLLSYKLICYEKLEDLEKAEKYEYEILGKNYENTSAMQNIIDIYSNLKDVNGALTYVDKLIEKKGEFKEFKAILLTELGKYEESIELSNEILLENPNNITLLNTTGMSYIKLKDYEKSIEFFLRSYELDPENIDTLEGLGISYYFNDDFEKAYNSLNKSLELNENDETALEYLCHTTLELEKYMETIDYANKLLTLSEDCDGIFNDLAIAYFELGDHFNGFRCLSLAAIANESTEGPWITKASFFSSQGKKSEAEECFEKAIEVNPKNPMIYIARTEHYKKFDEIKEAKKDYEQILKIDPKYSISFEDM